MSFPRIVLLLSSLPFAGIGVAFLVAPQTMGQLVGVHLADATAIADARAVYGGLQLGCAAFLAYASSQTSWLRPGLALQVATFGGLFGARLVSYAVSGLPSALGYLLHAGEALGLFIGLAAWIHLGRSSNPTIAPAPAPRTPRTG
jgi:hypothetical protein